MTSRGLRVDIVPARRMFVVGERACQSHVMDARLTLAQHLKKKIVSTM